MRGTGIIIRKELKRVFGDRKLVFSLFILPAILVIGIYSLMGVMISSMEKDIEEHVSQVYIVNKPASLDSIIGVVGYDSTADITCLDASGYAARKSELEDGVLNGSVDLVAVFALDFDEKVANYSQAGDVIPEIELCYNNTENYSSQAYSVFSAAVLNTYREALQAGRFGNLDLLNVFTVKDTQIVKEEKANTEFISMILPYLITMMLFAGAMSIGVDAIAGEKERGTLASMLLTPTSRNEIAFGKLVSMAILSGLSAIVYSVAMIIAMPIMGSTMGELAENGFGGVSFNLWQCVELFVIMLVMVYLFVAVVGFLAVLAKDSKTASTYISPCYIVVIIAGMLTMFTAGGEIPIVRYAIPVYGNALAIKDLVGNELALANFGVSLLGTLACAVILTGAIAWAFNNEKIMFNA